MGILVRRVLVALLPAFFALGRADAQPYWRVPSGIGGALVGAGAGWAIDIASWSGRGAPLSGPTLVFTSIGIAAGGILGYAVGLGADQRLARGDTLSHATRRWLRGALFLSPVAIGSAITFAVINPS